MIRTTLSGLYNGIFVSGSIAFGFNIIVGFAEFAVDFKTQTLVDVEGAAAVRGG
jgi:hypothetical protein